MTTASAPDDQGSANNSINAIQNPSRHTEHGAAHGGELGRAGLYSNPLKINGNYNVNSIHFADRPLVLLTFQWNRTNCQILIDTGALCSIWPTNSLPLGANLEPPSGQFTGLSLTTADNDLLQAIDKDDFYGQWYSSNSVSLPSR